jgi:hypothetical protein
LIAIPDLAIFCQSLHPNTGIVNRIQLNFMGPEIFRNMPSLPRLTEMAHSLVAMWLQPGDYAIDATAGNGHDTVMLASLTGSKGHVLAVDIQQEGLENTRRRLEEQGLLNSHIQLVQGNHAELQRITPKNWAGKVRVIMFNLGFRPHAEIPVATRLVSTLSALGQSLGLLADFDTVSCSRWW